MEVGLAVGLIQVLHDNPVDGLHKKVPVPVTLSVVELPLQMDSSAPALRTGTGKVASKTKSVSVQLLSVTTSVYVVLEVGDATGLELLGLLKEAEGDQL